ncbi:MAG: class I SAM-dependent methyltransferase [Planctomycetaceae bacterium]|nr:class I SAM-dependent methyltransferase [Planctomycetaceae bacterium]MBT4013378.1 class I SAM-dependent methyltransferase [Planctomycetaceae bacterium]MBT4724377.1 class I SAM-dependent methyltransferase [Planctomycetaceae bacterium]MBT4845974.1 class I SAM-dependent methyltransferase [Planctomycetaceae bacterium]MBT5123790.1 class I SAM-dependent methyltransferase [Planctomycetaceae bacterium]
MPATREILDVGCGDGLFFPALSQFGNVTGVESDTEIVDPAGEFFEQIHIGQFDDSYQPHKQFQWITMLDVIEHIPDATSALQLASALLTDDGKVLITVPAFNLLWTKHDDFNHHQTRYNKRLLKRQTTAAGLKIINMHYFYHWTFAAKLLVRLKESIVTAPPASAQVPATWVNKTCQTLCQIEQRFITPLRLPFGSSLFAIAVRS